MTGNKDKPYTGEDLHEVLDNPEWTEEMFARAKPLSEFAPELAESLRRARGPQKAPTKRLISLRLDQDVIEHFKATGPGWQTRINAVLREAMADAVRNAS
jgi:uncharacterized protein (DUF4415 family)